MDTTGGAADALPEEHEVELVDQLSEPTLEEFSVTDQLVEVERTSTSGVNTNPEWESEVAAMFEHSCSLSKHLECVCERQSQEDTEHGRQQRKLQQRKDEATREHQALLDKMESVRVKLQLNNSKASRKKFQSERQKLVLEKSRAEEETNRLDKELEQSNLKLSELKDEQSEERRRWKEELEELQVEMKRMQGEAQAAQQQRILDEMGAVEKQRSLAMARIDAWCTEVEQYLSILQEAFPPMYVKEKPKWEKSRSAALTSQANLRVRFNDALQQLQRGSDLEVPLRISEPPLPPVPMADVKFNQLMVSLSPIQVPAHPQPAHPAPPFHSHRPAYQPRQPFPSPRMLAPNPSPPPPPNAADKLEQLLKSLGEHYPQCTAGELKMLLQQVKSSRGTLAGLSHNELIEQVGFKLAPKQQPSTGPLAHLPGPIQRPRPRAPGLQGPPTPQPRKLCLMCQNPVVPEDRYPFPCSHIVHGDCIQVWIQSSKNNFCPFCSKK